MPAWRKTQNRKNNHRKDLLISRTVTDMETVMRKAVDAIIDHANLTGKFFDPPLNGMFQVSDNFYFHIVEQSWYATQEEKNAQKGKKRLALKDAPIGLPRDLKSMEKIFRDKRYWPKILKRSKTLTERLRKSYLQKLRRKFKDLWPQLSSGTLGPKEAKAKMMQAWDASKSRVETIFRTETTTYFAKVQTNFFQSDPEIIGFLFDSVRDIARTDICKSRHGMIYRKEYTGIHSISYNTPSLHFNCRSELIPLANTPENQKMVDDPKRDPRKHITVPLPKGWR